MFQYAISCIKTIADTLGKRPRLLDDEEAAVSSKKDLEINTNAYKGISSTRKRHELILCMY